MRFLHRKKESRLSLSIRFREKARMAGRFPQNGTLGVRAEPNLLPLGIGSRKFLGREPRSKHTRNPALLHWRACGGRQSVQCATAPILRVSIRSCPLARNRSRISRPSARLSCTCSKTSAPQPRPPFNTSIVQSTLNRRQIWSKISKYCRR